jgi:MFS family permease
MFRNLKTLFYGWRVVAGAFVLAVFGWGMGFYGPPVWLGVVHATRGWPIALISAAVTLHFLVGAGIGAFVPNLYRRFGASRVTMTGSLCMACGVVGWAFASAPWQLFGASMLTGLGWGTMSAPAINALVSPWFARKRPAALGMAYNGGSIGGVIFSPLWVAAVALLGFIGSSLAIAAVMLCLVWVLAALLFSRAPQQLGLQQDGDVAGGATIRKHSPIAPLPGGALLRDRKFLTLAAGMAFGLFAQIGLVAHLFTLLTPALGAQYAGFAMGFVTLLAIVGRTAMGYLMPSNADRRLIACAGYVLQCAGSVVLLAAGGTSVPLLLAGIVLFGCGFGNATSLPPLIAQVEFADEDVPRAVSLVVASAQAAYAFAPATFGVIRDWLPAAGLASNGGTGVFIFAAIVQALAIGIFCAGRSARRPSGVAYRVGTGFSPR